MMLISALVAALLVFALFLAALTSSPQPDVSGEAGGPAKAGAGQE